jgi:hypothetical protein
VPLPSVEFSLQTLPTPVLRVSVVPKSLPISSVHANRPFVLAVLLGGVEVVTTRAFCVSAKEPKDPPRRHVPLIRRAEKAEKSVVRSGGASDDRSSSLVTMSDTVSLAALGHEAILAPFLAKPPVHDDHHCSSDAVRVRLRAGERSADAIAPTLARRRAPPSAECLSVLVGETLGSSVVVDVVSEDGVVVQRGPVSLGASASAIAASLDGSGEVSPRMKVLQEMERSAVSDAASRRIVLKSLSATTTGHRSATAKRLKRARDEETARKPTIPGPSSSSGRFGTLDEEDVGRRLSQMASVSAVDLTALKNVLKDEDQHSVAFRAWADSEEFERVFGRRRRSTDEAVADGPTSFPQGYGSTTSMVPEPQPMMRRSVSEGHALGASDDASFELFRELGIAPADEDVGLFMDEEDEVGAAPPLMTASASRVMVSGSPDRATRLG